MVEQIQQRRILKDQGLYIGVVNQMYTDPSRISVGGWRSENETDFVDATKRQKALLEVFGSPVIVYPDGRVEKEGVPIKDLIELAKQKLSDLESVEIQLGNATTSEMIEKISMQKDVINQFLGSYPIFDKSTKKS